MCLTGARVGENTQIVNVCLNEKVQRRVTSKEQEKL